MSRMCGSQIEQVKEGKPGLYKVTLESTQDDGTKKVEVEEFNTVWGADTITTTVLVPCACACARSRCSRRIALAGTREQRLDPYDA